jgi:CheY-like chemotaxis protein
MTEKRAKGLRILVVDDNKDAADALSKLLQLWGHTVRTAYDELAVDLVPAFQPEAVLLDIGMPRMDGHTMAPQVRQRCANQGVLVIAVTGFHDEAVRKRSQEAGFDHYLVKPVDTNALKKLLDQKLLGKQQQAAGVPKKETTG